MGSVEVVEAVAVQGVKEVSIVVEVVAGTVARDNEEVSKPGLEYAACLAAQAMPITMQSSYLVRCSCRCRNAELHTRSAGLTDMMQQTAPTQGYQMAFSQVQLCGRFLSLV